MNFQRYEFPKLSYFPLLHFQSSIERCLFENFILKKTYLKQFKEPDLTLSYLVTEKWNFFTNLQRTTKFHPQKDISKIWGTGYYSKWFSCWEVFTNLQRTTNYPTEIQCHNRYFHLGIENNRESPDKFGNCKLGTETNVHIVPWENDAHRLSYHLLF